jgi:hypothetical protein
MSLIPVNVVDRHRTSGEDFGSDADLDQDPTPSLSHVEKSEYFLKILFNSYQLQSALFIFLDNVVGVIVFIVSIFLIVH